MPSIRSLLVSLLVGLVHAGTLVAVALTLGYSIGPSEYTILGMGWRYGSLVVVAAVPAWLVVRYRIIAPLLALSVTTGYVLGMELTPPGPTFRDVAELVRHLVVAPSTVLTAFILLDVQAEFTASPSDPHALYFGAWFLYLAILLIVAGIEFGLRRLQIGQQLRLPI